MVRRLAVLAASCVTGAAFAADNGVYLGLGAERSDFNFDGALDNTDNGLKLIGGVRLLDSFGVELNYADHAHRARAIAIARPTATARAEIPRC